MDLGLDVVVFEVGFLAERVAVGAAGSWFAVSKLLSLRYFLHLSTSSAWSIAHQVAVPSTGPRIQEGASPEEAGGVVDIISYL